MNVDRKRMMLVEATQHLLGTTMNLTEEQWRADSDIPEWTRAHVATHIARNADAMARVVRGMLAGEPVLMYPSAEARRDDIAAGAQRSALDLQVDLDSSATRLEEAFDDVTDWSVPVQLHPQVRLDRVEDMITHRTLEVVIHHIDLGCGMTFADIDTDTASVLLERFVGRLRIHPDSPALRIEPTDGEALTTRDDDAAAVVSGTSADLLGWLTRRTDASRVTCADGITLPAM